MLKVYHNQKFLDFSFLWGKDKFPARDDLKIAALVDTDDLEKAFELTNNIDHPWPQNPGVTCVTAQPRSTSCGDAIRDEQSRWFLCAGVGWVQFNPWTQTKVD
jgi:hypothetical protein